MLAQFTEVTDISDTFVMGNSIEHVESITSITYARDTESITFTTSTGGKYTAFLRDEEDSIRTFQDFRSSLNAEENRLILLRRACVSAYNKDIMHKENSVRMINKDLADTGVKPIVNSKAMHVFGACAITDTGTDL